VLVVVAPGQGAQVPGFLTPWLELPTVTERLEWLSTVAGVDLITHGTTSDADTIRDTAIAQPLLVAAGLVTLLELFPHPAEGFTRIGAGAGHSVGEITAAAAAGVLTAEQAMVFVRERGRAMAAASAAVPTGMWSPVDSVTLPPSPRTHPTRRACAPSRSPERSTPNSWRRLSMSWPVTRGRSPPMIHACG